MIFVLGVLPYVLLLGPLGVALMRTAAWADATVLRQERRVKRPRRRTSER